eukprot:gene5441-7198_t
MQPTVAAGPPARTGGNAPSCHRHGRFMHGSCTAPTIAATQGAATMKELPMPMMPLVGMLKFRNVRTPAVASAATRPSAADLTPEGFQVVWARHQDEVRAAQR